MLAPLPMTPEQLRTRAAGFEAAIRRRNWRDQVSFALVAALSLLAVWQDNLMVRVGATLTGVWAVWSMFALHRFGAVERAPAEATTATCAAWHQHHLERQRDLVLSWPWGIGLVIPGFVLTVVGLGGGGRDSNWVFPAVMSGLMLFLYIAVVLYGKMRAAHWQREIDALRALRN